MQLFNINIQVIIDLFFNVFLAFKSKWQTSDQHQIYQSCDIDCGGRFQAWMKDVEGRVSRSECFCGSWWGDEMLEQHVAPAMQQTVLRRSVALIEHHTRRPNKSISSYSHTGTLCAFIIHEPQMNNTSAVMNRLPSSRVEQIYRRNMKIWAHLVV